MSLRLRQILSNPYICILLLGIAYFIFVEISHYRAHTIPPHATILNAIQTNYFLTNSCLGGALLALLVTPLTKKELVILSICSIIAEYFMWIMRDPNNTILYNLLLAGVGAFGVCSVHIVAKIAIYVRKGEADRALELLEIFAMMVPMAMMYGIYLPDNTGDLRIYDPMLLAADSLTGTQPSFIITAFLCKYAWLTQLMIYVYAYLPTWMLLAQAFVYREEKRGNICSPYIPAISYLATVPLGLLSYSYLPAIGTELYCGVNIFPNGPIPEVTSVPQAVEAPFQFQRNCMPSLHLSLIICAFLSVVNLGKRYALPFFALVVMTLFSAFQVGQHWMTDFLVALPFVVGYLGIISHRIPKTMRYGMALSGGLASFFMMYMIKENITVCLAHPTVYWFTIAIIDISSIFALWLLVTETKGNER